MTVIKQTSVTSPKHLARLKGYLSWDKDKVLAHDTMNIMEERRWFEEMDETREAFGHNKPGRKGARCTYMQHQVLAFNPDECSCNGGPMTPERCMDYARDYVLSRYPDQEVVIVLHSERCKGDGSERYAAHMGINRSNLATGRRLDEGPARKAALARVRTVRELDERYGLRQLERGKANSLAHARQPSEAERDMARKGHPERSENARVRAIVAKRIDEVGRMSRCDDRLGELSRRLAKDGITLTKSKRNQLQYQFKSKSLGRVRRINGARLGFALNRATGQVIRFTARGVRDAMRLAMELEREQGREM